MTEEEARQWPDLMQIVEEKVKPEAIELRESIGETIAETGGSMRDTAPGLYNAIRGLERVLVLPMISKHVAFAFLPVGMVVFAKR